MAPYLILVGLVLGLIGSTLLIWDEMRSSVASIKDYLKEERGKLTGHIFKRFAFFVARPRVFRRARPTDLPR